MEKFLKDNWFVAIVAVFFLAISVFFAYDQNKDKLPGKTVNGKDVVYSVDDKDTTADELYEDLYNDYAKNSIYMTFYKAVCDEAVPTTTELTQNVNSYVDSTVSYYQSYYGYGESYLNYLAQYYYGYSTFREYVLYSLKTESIMNEYASAHLDTLYTSEVAEKLSPRYISYCLIKFADPKNPTADDLKRLEDAKTAWASDEYNAENFAEFAKEFSEDNSTSENGGSLGYTDANSSLVEGFLKAALALKEGEVSEWVEEPTYGYFLIKCDSTKLEEYKEDPAFLASVIDSADDNLSATVIWEKAQSLGVKINNAELENVVKEALGLTESEGNK